MKRKPVKQGMTCQANPYPAQVTSKNLTDKLQKCHTKIEVMPCAINYHTTTSMIMLLHTCI